jgi:AcrR family transcriptional regulator
MPKAFSAREKETIRALLHEKDKTLFEKQGLRKTTVDELTKATGISKGAFYLFYPSKEGLFLEILEELEADLRARIFQVAMDDRLNARQRLAALFTDALLTWDQYPLLKNFSRAEYEYLAHKLPAQRVRTHADRDERFVEEFMKRLKQEKLTMKASPRLITNLMKSLFFVSLHREDLGAEAYIESMEVLADLIARYLTEGK